LEGKNNRKVLRAEYALRITSFNIFAESDVLESREVKSLATEPGIKATLGPQREKAHI
jgi:hypothetical protein